ncbi:hypothetical protein PACTADRAFT_32635 [Pachysolen tannophilus NRRL Y-2460]|uniref:mRNA stability protein n=1 Tax=Pachysolen tannophilus NRRL Y-2460 TaxID=669874 RepID=A0A1E4TZH7_PACTA|nr:hypothetical protein PACTADRAFT_32635 [Pachysolen tannophilus NRRL Y-2460]
MAANQLKGTDEVDTSKLSPQELKIYKLYGKLPSRSDLLHSKLKDRKYFDSGDYAMSKAGVIKNEGPLENLKHPDLEKIQRINRNSVSGSNSRGSICGVIGSQNGGNVMFSGKSNLEKEVKGEDNNEGK